MWYFSPGLNPNSAFPLDLNYHFLWTFVFFLFSMLARYECLLLMMRSSLAMVVSALFMFILILSLIGSKVQQISS